MCDVWNLFKVNSKGTRTTSYLYLLLTLNILHTFFWLYCWHWACVFAGFENVYFRAILTKSVVLRDVVYKNLTSVLQYILRTWRWFKTRNPFFSLKRNILWSFWIFYKNASLQRQLGVSSAFLIKAEIIISIWKDRNIRISIIKNFAKFTRKQVQWRFFLK